MHERVTLTRTIHFGTGRRGRKELHEGAPASPAPRGTVPRVVRLMALAIRLEQLLQERLVTNQAELARVGHVSRARVTQIMNLLNLAPDIQEAILSLPRIQKGRAEITERDLRPIAALPDWRTQRRTWSLLIAKPGTRDLAASK